MDTLDKGIVHIPEETAQDFIALLRWWYIVENLGITSFWNF